MSRDAIEAFETNSGTIENASQTEPFQFLFSKENWVQVHFSLPMKIRLLYVDGYRDCLIIIALWEYAETLVYALIKKIWGQSQINTSLVGVQGKKVIEWFGENPGDSILGDLTIGALAIALASYYRTRYYPRVGNVVYRSRTARAQVWHLVLFCLEALSNAIGTFQFKLRKPIAIVFGAWSSFFSLFPFGQICYMPISLVLVEAMRLIDVYCVEMHNRQHVSDVLEMYALWQVYHVVTWSFTFYYLVYTYPSVLLSALLVTVIILLSKN
jgi:hypothetical protein